MVQFLVMNRWREAIKDNNSYWKLGLYQDKTAREAVEYLDNRGYLCRENASKAVALDAIGRYQRGLMSYEGLSVSDLDSLCKTKGLSTKAKTSSRLVRALEKADGNTSFRLLDLPPEIRNMIYEFHFLDLADVDRAHVQPPLTLASTQLRTEALPLFYGHATFVFMINSMTDVDNFGINTTDFAPTARDLLNMPSTNFSQIKNLTLVWQDCSRGWRRDHWHEYLSVHLTQHDVAGKAVTITGTRLQERYESLDDSLRASIRGFGFWENDYSLQLEHIESFVAGVPKVSGF